MGIGGIGRVIGLRLARGGTAVVVHGRFDRAAAGPGEIAAGRDQSTAPLR
jgi:NAD(P)-dependent dehydrogenase (short-subunit alcohol dehydrogenase family)